MDTYITIDGTTYKQAGSNTEDTQVLVTLLSNLTRLPRTFESIPEVIPEEYFVPTITVSNKPPRYY